MSRDSHLSGEQNVPAQDRAPGQTRLCADDIVLADYTGVSDLNKAVHFGATLYSGFSDCRTVHRRQSLDLDIVFDNSNSGLHDLFVRAVCPFSESEAVTTDDDTVL